MSEGAGAGGLGSLSKKLSRGLDTLRGRGADLWTEAIEGRLSWLFPVRLQELLARRGWGPPTRMLGLDVDGSQVFAVELCRRGNVVVVERAAQFSLPAPAQGADATGTVGREAADLDVGQAAAVVQELTRRGFSARQMATVVSRERTFERTFQLPAGTRAELEAMAALRSEHEMPLAAEEACVDFLFVDRPQAAGGASWPPAAEGAGGHLVVVCAASKAVVEKKTAPWVEAGLEPLALEVVGQSAFRALGPLRQQRGGGPAEERGGVVSTWPPVAAEATGGAAARRAGPASERLRPSRREPSAEAEAPAVPLQGAPAAAGLVCLVVVRERVTELVIGGERPQFSRALQPGGLAWAGDAQGVPASEEGRLAAEPPEARLAREVTRTLQAFASEFPDEVVERVVLVSRFAVNRGVLERAVGLPVEVPTNLPAAALGMDTGPVGELKVTFAPAVGVAWPEVAWRAGVPMHLERVNLLTQRQARWERERRYRRARVAVLAIVLAVVGTLLPMSVAAVRLANLVMLGRKLEALGPQVKELEAIEQRLALLRPWTVDKALSLDILAELTRVATPEVYVKSVSLNEGGRLELKGLATGYEGAYALVGALAENSKLLSDVSLVGGQRGESGEAGVDPRFSYQFTAKAQVPGWPAQARVRAPASTAGPQQEASAAEEPR